MQLPSFSPLDYFANLVHEDARLPLLEAAVSVAQDEVPDLDVQGVLAEVDRLGQRLRARLPREATPPQRLAALSQFFHVELGFQGNVNDYYAPVNSFVHHVLETRRGLPISLAILLLELAEQAGLRAAGVAFPGHFLVKFRIGLGDVVMDPFSGDALTQSRLEERLQVYRRGSGLPDDLELPLEFFLRGTPRRHILARLLRNLKEIYRSAEDWPRFLAVQRRLVILLPDDAGELRDRGLALEALGQWEAAADDLDAYLRRQAEAVDAPQLRERLKALGRRHPPRRR